MLVQWLLRNEYSKRNFSTDAQVIADAGRALNYNQLFLFNATNYTFEAISVLLESQEKIANLSGFVKRVADFDNALLRSSTVSVTSGTQATNFIEASNLNLVTPTGDVLAEKLNVIVNQHEPLVVTGPTGSGKTAFFRTIGGLWPPSPDATVSIPLKEGTPDLFLVPQKVYCPPGNLADQITYPIRLTNRTAEDESTLIEILKWVGVDYLVSRQNGWETIVKWTDVLSLGEQQRLGMARLFYHKPMFGVLDECTSAVSVDVEEALYRKAKDLGITSITISQRLALEQFHTQELKLGEVDHPLRWRLNKLRASSYIESSQESGPDNDLD